MFVVRRLQFSDYLRAMISWIRDGGISNFSTGGMVSPLHNGSSLDAFILIALRGAAMLEFAIVPLYILLGGRYHWVRCSSDHALHQCIVRRSVLVSVAISTTSRWRHSCAWNVATAPTRTSASD